MLPDCDNNGAIRNLAALKIVPELPVF